MWEDNAAAWDDTEKKSFGRTSATMNARNHARFLGHALAQKCNNSKKNAKVVLSHFSALPAIKPIFEGILHEQLGGHDPEVCRAMVDQAINVHSELRKMTAARDREGGGANQHNMLRVAKKWAAITVVAVRVMTMCFGRTAMERPKARSTS